MDPNIVEVVVVGVVWSIYDIPTRDAPVVVVQGGGWGPRWPVRDLAERRIFESFQRWPTRLVWDFGD